MGQKVRVGRGVWGKQVHALVIAFLEADGLASSAYLGASQQELHSAPPSARGKAFSLSQGFGDPARSQQVKNWLLGTTGCFGGGWGALFFWITRPPSCLSRTQAALTQP